MTTVPLPHRALDIDILVWTKEGTLPSTSIVTGIEAWAARVQVRMRTQIRNDTLILEARGVDGEKMRVLLGTLQRARCGIAVRTPSEKGPGTK